MTDHPKASRGFACPKCNKLFSKVTNTYTKTGEVVRYRRCLNCGSLFSTSEVPRETSGKVASTPPKKRTRKKTAKKIAKKTT